MWQQVRCTEGSRSSAGDGTDDDVTGYDSESSDEDASDKEYYSESEEMRKMDCA